MFLAYMGKRLFDILISLGLLGLLWPLLLVVAALVWIESGRPILFSQLRIGRRFQWFRIWKFRSMRSDRAGLRITVQGEARVTTVGKFIRATKIDELPQLWNVLRGDMSMVGPRPELPEYVEFYRHRYRNVLELRPGVTDLASLRFCDEEVMLAAAADPQREYLERLLPRKLDLAEEYLRRRSPLLDAYILLRTLLVPWSKTRI